jgi:hypothetical protein
MRFVFGLSAALLASFALVACSDETTPSTPDDDDAGSSTADSGAAKDSGSTLVDSGTTTDAGSTTDSSATVDAAPLSPTFTNVYDSVLNKKCTRCHGDTHSTGLAMGTKAAAHTNLVGKAAGAGGTSACGTAGGETRVVANNPTGSLLIKKIDHVAGVCGSPMPLGDDKMDAASIKLITDWIAAGAPND